MEVNTRWWCSIVLMFMCVVLNLCIFSFNNHPLISCHPYLPHLIGHLVMGKFYCSIYTFKFCCSMLKLRIKIVVHFKLRNKKYKLFFDSLKYRLNKLFETLMQTYC
jgi:hypothetical protein